MFDNKFGKRGQIFKILSPIDFLRKLSMYTHKDFQLTCNVLLHYGHYLVKVENEKNVPEFSR